MTEINKTEGCIRAEHLHKTYSIRDTGLAGFWHVRKQVTAVDDLSITIPKGKITGLLGVNGAGKTTTIRMLSSILQPTSGQIHCNGVDIVKNPMWMKARINVITGGERNLYWRLTAKENLDYFGALYGVPGKERKARIQELLSLVKLSDAANIPVERYSKGMKQRLQVARGLINDPEYLFLDEPTLGLDIVIASEIRGMIRELAANQNRGILLTTHIIQEAEELCDVIYVMDHGKLIAEGSKEELASFLDREPKMVLQEPGLEEILLEILS